jgi:hypothetical protein
MSDQHLHALGHVLLGGCLATFLGIACGASSHQQIIERMIDSSAFLTTQPIKLTEVKLLGPTPQHDQTLNPFCKLHLCYVYTDEEVRIEKKYVTELEDRLRACGK